MAYFIALLQLLSVLFVEMMQILNLVMLFDIKDIIENFVSLLILD
jgi:glycopeptide antibiotics resistance protein